tara:strand:- start:960 stop:1631 length:672 start_codon:yes stop_codon:yes gene_type:complete
MGFKEENIFGSSLEALGGGAASTAAGITLATALGSNPIGWAVGLALGLGAGANALFGFKEKRQLRRLGKKLRGLAGEDYTSTQKGLAIKHALAKTRVRGEQIGRGHDIRGVSIQKDPVTGMAVEEAGPASSVAGVSIGRQKALSELERGQAAREWEKYKISEKMSRKSKSGMRGALSNFIAGNLKLILSGAFDDMGSDPSVPPIAQGRHEWATQTPYTGGWTP